jgi:hypothetical protein
MNGIEIKKIEKIGFLEGFKKGWNEATYAEKFAVGLMLVGITLKIASWIVIGMADKKHE